MRCTFLIFLFLSLNISAKELGLKEAVLFAEQFVLENGYTSSDNVIYKDPLDLEGIERSNKKEDILKSRYGSLLSKAIGAKKSDYSWSVAFDFGKYKSDKLCRVVVFKLDGSLPFMAHQSGLKTYFSGFE